MNGFKVFLFLAVTWNFVFALAVPHNTENKYEDLRDSTRNSADLDINNAKEGDLLHSTVPNQANEKPPLHSIVVTEGSSTKTGSRKRAGRFFGITTGAAGNNLQLGLSFIVPFMNIPFGGGAASSSYYGANYATTPSYGTSTSLLGVNSSSIIYAVIIGLAAIILIPLFIYSFTGVSTSPYGRSDDIQSILTNLAARIDGALQQQYNIDASSCMQRAICSQISSSTKRMAEGTAGSIEKILDGIASNHYLNTFLSGTKIQEALNVARQTGATCTKYYAKCPYSIDSINSSLANYAEMYAMKQENGDDFPDSFNDIPL